MMSASKSFTIESTCSIAPSCASNLRSIKPQLTTTISSFLFLLSLEKHLTISAGLLYISCLHSRSTPLTTFRSHS
ncbi:hypothetical protein IMY05_001G0026900 [Salix suchowensis]|nr:hypothetical protein IMY05_001G0026900 [Salix suchowensis]